MTAQLAVPFSEAVKLPERYAFPPLYTWNNVTPLSSTLNKGSPAVGVSDITSIFPLFIPVNTTSPEADTFRLTLVTLAVNNIADAVSTVPWLPPAFNAYDAVIALYAQLDVPYNEPVIPLRAVKEPDTVKLPVTNSVELVIFCT